ncbi:Lateral flagellar hook-associated protein 2 [Pseudomonas sp. 8AS]|uniref:flagellar filament capping protein FliD n=1 Tax=Pseudomonas sp. 8AS TaxID=2653163 RepID=UPI0012F0E47E|nr:flagellar filament capping protein FliD [Pseudomonas sp. 8AS]VXC27549.1 Lateral flagellar hook-associated protein 2 [Pseudomonas sp. 8AS]
MAIDTDYAKNMASQLANYQVQGAWTRAQNSEKAYQSQLKAVGTLDSALKSFRSAVTGLRSGGSSMLINSATFSQTGYASATVSASAAPGNYQFFVEQLASSHQLGFSGLASVPASGILKFQQGSDAARAFEVDLAGVSDADGDGTVSLSELASAINAAPDNTGMTASVVRSTDANGDPLYTLLLSSNESGAANAITVTDGAGFLGAATELSAAKDARVRLGGETGMLLTNSSNTFSNMIDGVSLTFTKAHAPGETPLSLTVGQDKTATEAKMKSFIDAFNTLMSTFDSLTASGGKDSERGSLAGDSSIRSVESMLNQVVRTAFGGKSLIDFGVAADRNGKLALNAERFAKALAADPAGLDKLFSEKDNLIDSIDKNIAVYTGSVNGVMKNRKEFINAQIGRVQDQYEALDRQYEIYYGRYLRQYTNMMEIMSSMQQTQGMFG